MMQTATLVFSENEARQATIAAHTQAVERAIQTMHTHLQEELTLEDLAAAAYLSPFYFNRVFRRLVGVPPGEFLSALRFQTARCLLLTTPLSITDVCFEVGYTSTGSFTSRFTQLVGISPRLLRRRADEFEPMSVERNEFSFEKYPDLPFRNMLLGRISTPETFQGTIYVGLFRSPIPQGVPVRCTRLGSPGLYMLPNVPDGVYYLRSAAFPRASELQACLLPGEKMLVGQNPRPLVMRQGQLFGNPDLVLHTPQLIDPPLVMGLPLL